MTETVNRANSSKDHIGSVITLNVSYSPKYKTEEFHELEVSGRLVGVTDVYSDDGSNVDVSTWAFEPPVGIVQVNWDQSRLLGEYVSKIRTVEVTA